MILRLATVADHDALVDLFTASVHGLAAGDYDADQRAAWAPPTPDRAAWAERFAALHTLVAEVDGRLVGLLAYDDGGHIDLLFTHPDVGRRGVASRLYDAVEATLVVAGVDALTTEASLTAQPFFASKGFVVAREETVVRRGVSFRRFVMRKDVRRAPLGA